MIPAFLYLSTSSVLTDWLENPSRNSLYKFPELLPPCQIHVM